MTASAPTAGHAMVVWTVLVTAAAVADSAPSAPNALTGRTLRVDHFHWGDAKAERISPGAVVAEGVWSGNPDHPVTPFDRGRYRASPVEPPSGRPFFRMDCIMFDKGLTPFCAVRRRAPAETIALYPGTPIPEAEVGGND